MPLWCFIQQTYRQMEADCSSSSFPQKSFPGTKSFGSYRTRVSNNFRLEKDNFFAPFYNFESRCKNTVTLLIVDSHAQRALRFGTYRTIVLGPKQPSFEKNTPLVFHSTNLTTDGSRLFFSISCPQNVSPGHKVSVAIKQECLTTFF